MARLRPLAFHLSLLWGICAAFNCTSKEETYYHQEGGEAVYDISNICGKKAYSIWQGRLDHAKFNKCFTEYLPGFSNSCSECFLVYGDYTVANCKFKCLGKEHSEGCLTCSAGGDQAFCDCAGFYPDHLTPQDGGLQDWMIVLVIVAVIMVCCGAPCFLCYKFCPCTQLRSRFAKHSSSLGTSLQPQQHETNQEKEHSLA